jgi:hypothetical protein
MPSSSGNWLWIVLPNGLSPIRLLGHTNVTVSHVASMMLEHM